MAQVNFISSEEEIMNSDGVNRINFLRQLYQSQETGGSSEEIRVLQKIKNELKIANDEKTRENKAITNATNSPYLSDQIFYKKDVIYNSPEETKWREVKSAEQALHDVQPEYVESNRRKLNII
jgi:hypothetical protein